jgi:hypothetical protein
MRKEPLYKAIASTLDAYKRCIETGNKEWEDKHGELLEEFQGNYYPSGSGFNQGTTLDLEKSTPNKLVFHTAFHHMDGSGFYDGWTQHTVNISPDFVHTLNISISGKNRNDIKELIHQEFHHVLSMEVEY